MSDEHINLLQATRDLLVLDGDASMSSNQRGYLSDVLIALAATASTDEAGHVQAALNGYYGGMVEDGFAGAAKPSLADGQLDEIAELLDSLPIEVRWQGDSVVNRVRMLVSQVGGLIAQVDGLIAQRDGAQKNGLALQNRLDGLLDFEVMVANIEKALVIDGAPFAPECMLDGRVQALADAYRRMLLVFAGRPEAQLSPAGPFASAAGTMTGNNEAAS